MSPLISTTDLAALLGAEDLRIFDTRASLADYDLGQRLYLEGHLPGAQFLDLERDLSGTLIRGQTGRHPLPAPALLGERLRALGLEQNSHVVIYDDGPGYFAARLWWLLRWLGHNRVQVLDGGFAAWQREGLPVSSEIEAVSPGSFREQSDMSRVVDSDEVLAMLDHDDRLLIDARASERFRGEKEPIDPVAGHIPGAHCLPCSDNVDADGHFLSPEQLRQRFSALPADTLCVSYCGSGVTACHNILAAVIAGLPEPRLYAGSWSEWITDPDRPVG